MAVGDFDLDGHADVVAARRGDGALYLLPGANQGELGPARRVGLAGGVTALATGEVDRRDGHDDLVVGIDAGGRGEVLIFPASRAGLDAEPEVIVLLAPPAALATGTVDEDHYRDVVAATGSELVVVLGRDCRTRASRPGPRDVRRVTLPEPARALLVQRALEGCGSEVVALTASGDVDAVACEPLLAGRVETRRVSGAATGAWLASARGGAGGRMLVTGRGAAIALVADGEPASARPEASPGRETLRAVGGEPLAAVALRTGSGASESLVVLTPGSPRPELLPAPAAAIRTVTNANSSGAGSLVDAINAAQNGDRIEFAIPGPPPYRIPITSMLFNQIVDLTIDATTQPGYAGAPVVEVDGSGLPPATNALLLIATNVAVRGLAVTGAPGTGISLGILGVVEGCYVGLRPDGLTVAGNRTGITVGEGGLIGGSVPAARNVISGNILVGISAIGFFSRVEGSYIGTDATGTLARGNGTGTSGGDQIKGNLVSGNTVDGIETSAIGQLVRGNYLGTDKTGTSALPNRQAGLNVRNARNVTVGGLAPGDGNLISGNLLCGLYAQRNSGVSTMFVHGNLIGTDVSGTAALGNGVGIGLEEGSDIRIGGVGAGEGNLISGNRGNGIEAAVDVDGLVILGNAIGLDAAGAPRLGNGGHGVRLEASVCAVGGTAGEENDIEANGGAGIFIETVSQGNRISGNRLAGNGGLGIDLAPAGPTPNDPLDADLGANGLQNSPVLASATHTVDTATVSGTLDSARGGSYRIEVFRNVGCGTASAPAEALAFGGSVVVFTDLSGHASFTLSFPASPTEALTATATDTLSGDTSEISPCLAGDLDSDGDGLSDDWETHGIDVDGDRVVDLDLPALGADPRHKDVFVEIDYMDCAVAGGDCASPADHTHRPKDAAIAAVAQAFANAPLSNPDGAPGIRLHVDVSNAIAHHDRMVIPGACFALSPGDASFDAVKADPASFGLPNPRRFAYHYVLFTHHTRGFFSGCAELPGNDVQVSLGDWHHDCGPARDQPCGDIDGDGLDDTQGTAQEQAGTLMHELGHNLELRHGGGDGGNYKPNYQSVMSYFFQLEGIPPADPDGTGPLLQRVDYSRAELPALDENALSEPLGIQDGGDKTFYFTAGCTDNVSGVFGRACIPCSSGPACTCGLVEKRAAGTGPINWNNNCTSSETGIARDVNRDGSLERLAGFNDWASLLYDFRGTPSFADGVHQAVRELELDRTTAKQSSTPDLAVELGAAPIPVDAGGDVTLTARLANNSPGASRAAQLTLGLGPSLALRSCSPSGSGVCGGPASAPTAAYDVFRGGQEETVTVVAGVGCSVPDGTRLTVPAVLTSASDEREPADNQAEATVEVRNTPPNIQGLAAHPDVLWPPDHHMASVRLPYAAADACGPVSCAVAVTSNEPETGTGPGDLAPDWQVLDDHHVRLRRERAESGSGRVYTVAVTCSDVAGGATTARVEVHAPLRDPRPPNSSPSSH